jgi:hypothetical protein
MGVASFIFWGLKSMRSCEINSITSELVLGKMRQIFFGKINLLCIDDNADICNLFCNEFFISPVLNRKSVQNIPDAKQAISGRIPYHCWMLDLTLERHNDGLELLKYKQNFPFCIVVSGARSMEDANLAKNAGAFSVHDKIKLFQFSIKNLIHEACGLSALSFLLRAKKPINFDLFKILVQEFIQTPEEWKRKFPITDITFRRICHENSLISPKQFLNLFHALNFVLLSDCLTNTAANYREISDNFFSRSDFYVKCSEYVIAHFDSIYASLYF